MKSLLFTAKFTVIEFHVGRFRTSVRNQKVGMYFIFLSKRVLKPTQKYPPNENITEAFAANTQFRKSDLVFSYLHKSHILGKINVCQSIKQAIWPLKKRNKASVFFIAFTQNCRTFMQEWFIHRHLQHHSFRYPDIK